MEPTATVKEVNGQLVLEDPIAFEVIQAVNRKNCETSFKLNEDRISHFKLRIIERKLPITDYVVIITNVDDIHGSSIANALMPGYDWEQFRSQGQTPFARGICSRQWIEQVLKVFDKTSAEKLKQVKNEIATVVVDYGVAEIYI